MNEQAQIGIKLDKALKEDVDIILRGLGIKPTMAITGLYQYILRHGALPFIIHTQVHTPQTLFGHLFMDYSVLKRTLGGILQPLTDGGRISEHERMGVMNMMREFTLNLRQLERVLPAPVRGQQIDWKVAFNGARRAFYVLEAGLKRHDSGGHFLEEDGVIKLTLAHRMLCEAQVVRRP